MRYIKRTTGVGEVASAQGGVGELPATIRLRGHAATYHVRAGRTIDGPVLLGLRIDPDPGYEISSADLKLIPAQRIAAAAVTVGVDPADDFDPESCFTEIDFDNFDTPERAWTDDGAPRKGTVGHPREYGVDHYAKVAKVAIGARGSKHRGGARAAIVQWWKDETDTKISLQTADRWMRTARDHGLLPRSKRAPGITKGTETR